MIIGYARVSTRDQNLDLQLDALQKEKCDKIYKEIISGAKSERPILQEMLNQIRPGDVIVIWKLDRLGRSLRNLVDIVGQLINQGVGLKSLHDNIDTTTPQGRLTFNIFASLAEFERDLISERTKAGLESARARGRLGGKPKGLSKEAESTACAAETLYKEGKLSVNQIAKQLGIAKNTLYKYLRHRNVEISAYKLKQS
jgi:DNA invertase Pin-like site-specific DNA recombinase